ncbi:MAG: hypothetical protein ABFD65_13900 [Candidatus Polarisedimenticolia bacterium]
MIVVIASYSGPAWRVACLIDAGQVPPIHKSVEAARAWAQAHYPLPQRTFYEIFEFEKVGEDILIRARHPIRPSLDAPSSAA